MRRLLILIITLCISILFFACSGKENLSPVYQSSGMQAEELYNESVNLNSNEIFAAIADFDSLTSCLLLNCKNPMNAYELYFIKINGEMLYESATPATHTFEYTKIYLNRGFMPDTDVNVEIRLQLYSPSTGLISDKTYTNTVRTASKQVIVSADSLLQYNIPYHFTWRYSSKNQYQYVKMRAADYDETNGSFIFNQLVKGVDQNINDFYFPLNCVQPYSAENKVSASITGFNSSCKDKFLLFSQQSNYQYFPVQDSTSFCKK